MPKIDPPHFAFVPEVRDLLARRHMTVADFATAIGVSRGYASQLLDGKILSVRVRRAVLRSGIFADLPEAAFWSEITGTEDA